MTKEIEELENETAEEETTPDKDVELSTFNMYRNAFIREQLKELNVKEGAEMESALKFVDEKADATDSNLSEVMQELIIRMRITERPKYADPSFGNSLRGKPAKTDGTEVGRNMFSRLQERGLIR